MKEYLSHLNQKNSIEKSRLEILSIKNESEKQKIIESTTKSSVLTSYLQNIEKNKVTIGKDLKDNSQGFMVIKKVDEEVERLKRMVLNIPKKKRLTKEEKLKNVEGRLDEMIKEREKVEVEQKKEEVGRKREEEEGRREEEGRKDEEEGSVIKEMESMERRENNIEDEKECREEEKEKREKKGEKMEEEEGRKKEQQEIMEEERRSKDEEERRKEEGGSMEQEGKRKEEEGRRVEEEKNDDHLKTEIEDIKINEEIYEKNKQRQREDENNSLKKKDDHFELSLDLKKNFRSSPSSSSIPPPSLSFLPPPSSLPSSPFIPLDSSLPPPPFFPPQRIEPNISEEDINIELKRLEDEDLSLYTLEEQYQSYINMNNLDSESLQDKFNSLKNLLQIMGIPYIDSPSEAEAQCAFLESKGLVDGIITEDSDVFLFGGRKVYRGVFRKKMESYEMVRVEKELGLGRDKLILLAMFLGSDYTIGIKGVTN